MKTLTL